MCYSLLIVNTRIRDKFESHGTVCNVHKGRSAATLAALREEIEAACATIAEDTIVERTQKCIDADGEHFEHLL
ncbi:hypothetical protein C0J52_27013 [Blattella germanica]|nr:hypothetical protein C0J52_27013 [Blattella germanica]